MLPIFFPLVYSEASTAKQPPENPTNVNPLGLDGPSPDNTQSERRNPNAETTAHAAAIATTTAAASSSMTAALPAASALNSGSGSFVDRSLLETFTVASATAPISGSSNAVRGTIPRAPMVDLDPDDLMLADPKLHSRGPSSSSTMLSGGTAGVAPGSSQGWGSRLQLAVRNTIPVRQGSCKCTSRCTAQPGRGFLSVSLPFFGHHFQVRALLAVVAAALIFTGNLRAEMFLGLSPVLMLSVAQVAMILAMYSALGVHWIRIRVRVPQGSAYS